jgi:endogenous inhibitor of DNA gyrase (YacG/DUF329 family)
MPERQPELKNGRCPRCGRPFTYTTLAEHRPFPFCSARCRDVDLGHWLSGSYAIPGESVVQSEDGDESDAT